jgi:hypothetical protein
MMEEEIICCSNINTLNTTGQYMYQKFNIQQLHALPTLYLFILYFSEKKQRLVSLTEIED